MGKGGLQQESAGGVILMTSGVAALSGSHFKDEALGTTAICQMVVQDSIGAGCFR